MFLSIVIPHYNLPQEMLERCLRSILALGIPDNEYEIIVVDDLKPGYDMAKGAGVDFAAAGWAYDVREIEDFMRENCDYYLETVEDLRKILFE
jgi:cellulose synthase/poly-beta-1,6-N-acetylglucosamine synthase-like glycosyltransferase